METLEICSSLRLNHRLYESDVEMVADKEACIYSVPF